LDVAVLDLLAIQLPTAVFSIPAARIFYQLFSPFVLFGGVVRGNKSLA
jgi:hypothetical protein